MLVLPGLCLNSPEVDYFFIFHNAGLSGAGWAVRVGMTREG